MPPVALPPSHLSKPQRVLACVLCQQRKVKCDRKYPCSNCIKSLAQCVPATQSSRRRRRRFPERELLERLRKYEDLLRQNNIKFEPLHKHSAGEKESPSVEGGYDSDDEQPKTAGAVWSSPSTTVNSERVYEAKNIWHAMSQEFRDPDNNSDSSDDDVREVVFKKAWDQLFENNDHLLFGSRKTAVDISTLHPEPVQIFRLWQLYLENVNPLLKVTHTPSLQRRIIEAASNVLNIRPTLEALMFSIYCMSILSLAVDDCQAMFGSSKVDLLTRYQFGCQQALLNCGFLRCGDRDCLTALYLYLVSVRPSIVPQSLSSMLGVAIRIAQRIGIHSESVLAKCTALEAEMRRRLWWSLILFDTRIGEMADFKTTTLTPTWDCRIPLNVNDSDFRLEMKEPPQVQGKSTEALFAVVRSELGDFVRHTMFHLDFTSPALKPVAKDVQHGPIPEGSELVSLEKMIEDKYLKFCDPENPLHFMTIWTTKAYLAKCRLVEHYSRYSSSSVHQAEAQRDAPISYALSMLECDTKIMTSPLTKGFLWLVHFYFPFTAYIQIVQSLKRRPVSDQAELAWEVMSDNYEARFGLLRRDDSPFFKIFTKILLQAWEAREATFKQLGESLVTPRIVLSIRHQVAQIAQNAQNPDTGQPNGATDMGINNFLMSMPMGFGSHSLLYSMGGQASYAVTGPGAYPDMPGLAPLDVDVNQLDWSAMDWDLVNTPAGEAGESTGLSLPY
ncbi:hypothetical protein LIPSTDRAFT_57140 [Lipomyces starkeyi NRRL Y-11557]|uniref:Zn(2)-C6 fungal-type domain-containing protein n=1 Tax=Lipomyces starkeyi NRRL Y-11557 TaxID=675824 RepID=A0A1E3PZ23_LIPST|nr:hypothetical protein LIPSTDRAFT_57140 [Lipomyces starkeyi NRRL Y-11557]